MQKIITEKIGDKVIILLQEDLDASDHRLTRRLQSPRQTNQEFLVWVDCAHLECVRAYGVCHFINQLLLLKRTQNNIILLNLDDHQRQLLRLLQVEPLFRVVPDFEQAYQLVQAS
ncbi:hypothetical protein ACD591_18245 [Rufibacter glacialis]|uniref:STAS domain-containing protein n=1 Tax=Rufibacter glacialis TaxID=1259555 RepID=A0A5M8Q775_9BACT|nr:hypothetical protein [Rufibacter glacialis]KAA6430784.1 hypothetical protein FOE74_20165 [Rufibacter glacialis]GGK86694.1 hypothetical protein GCM10011405_38080 [Rufibacter glacialis]